MNYDINRLNNYEFEQLSQSLSQKIFRNAQITFGQGPDGGREATFQGMAYVSNSVDPWTGYWVVQAKFKNVRTEGESKDIGWLKSQIKSELEQFDKRKRAVSRPDNLLFFTNIILTGVAAEGGRDQLQDFLDKVKPLYGINNIRVFGYDDIVTLLNGNRDIACSFASFILPGDILFSLLSLQQKQGDRSKKVSEILGRFLEREFVADMYPKLEHAGKLTPERINLEKVFIDLHATQYGTIPGPKQPKFIATMIRLGNSILRNTEEVDSRVVLVAGPGYGKSTLTQFLTQIYRANYLSHTDKASTILPEVKAFLKEIEGDKDLLPVCTRVPFRITLKDYAAWIRKSDKHDEHSIVQYLLYQMNSGIGEGGIMGDELENIFRHLSCMFIFDGLDEVPPSSNRNEVLQEINFFIETILRRLYADALIIGTTRPQGYSNEFSPQYYKHLQIVDLNKQDCLVYITRLMDNIENDPRKKSEDLRILNSALNNPVLASLMRSPLQASFMSILVRSGGQPSTNKHDLFTEYFNTIVKREKQKNVAGILNSHEVYVKQIHYQLALTLQIDSESSQNPSASMDEANFFEFVKHYLITNKEIEPQIAHSYATQILEAAVRRLVFIDEVQEGKIGFTIRSFQEFFAAHKYVDTKDSEIHHKLFTIARAAYWGNTFIFSVANIYRNKEHLIDVVESVLNELNGSANTPFEQNSYLFSNFGAWIALDLLKEGVFRDHPKYENKFCRHLQLLLDLPYIERHAELLKLPQSLLNTWVVPAIQKNIVDAAGVSYVTSWIMLLNLAENDLSIHSRLDSIARGTLSVELIHQFILTNVIGSPVAIGEMIKTLNVLEYSEKQSLIRQLHSGAIMQLIISHAGTEILRVVFDVLFYEDHELPRPNLPADFDDCMIALCKLSGVTEMDLSYNQVFRMMAKETKFVIAEPGFSGSLVKMKHKRISIFLDILKLAEYVGSPVTRALVHFHITPTRKRLEILIEELIALDSAANSIVQNIKYTNWLCHEVFHNNLPLKALWHEVRNGRFGNESSWKLKEQRLFDTEQHDLDAQLAISFARTFEFDHSEKTLHNAFGLKSKISPENYHRELLNVLDWDLMGHTDILAKLKYNPSWQIDLITAVERYCFSETAFDQRKAFLLVQLLGKLEPIVIVKHFEIFNRLGKSIQIFKGVRLYSIDQSILKQALSNLVYIHPAASLNEGNPTIFKILPYILLKLLSIYLMSEVIDIPRKIELKNISCEDTLFAILCFALVTNDDPDYAIEIECAFTKINLDTVKLDILLTIIDNFGVDECNDKFMQHLQRKLIPERQIMAHCLNYCINRIQKTPSGLQNATV